jgi:hypothetical protein
MDELRIEELEQRIAPSVVGNPGTSNGARPEVPAGQHPQPNPRPGA